eukprot:403342968
MLEFKFSCNYKYLVVPINKDFKYNRGVTSNLAKTEFKVFDVGRYDYQPRTLKDIHFNEKQENNFKTQKLGPHPKLDELFIIIGERGEFAIIDIVQETFLVKKKETALYLNMPGHSNDICCMKFSHDGNMFVIGTEYGTISTFGLKTNQGCMIQPSEQYFLSDISHGDLLRILPEPKLVNIKDTQLCNQNQSVQLFNQSINKTNIEYEKNLELKYIEREKERNFIKCLKENAFSVDDSASQSLLEPDNQDSLDSMSIADSDFTSSVQNIISYPYVVFHNQAPQIINIPIPQQRNNQNNGNVGIPRRYYVSEIEELEDVQTFLEDLKQSSNKSQTADSISSVSENASPMSSDLKQNLPLKLVNFDRFNYSLEFQTCGFCGKSNKNLVGPFIQEAKNLTYYFHNHCLEVNEFISFEMNDGFEYYNINQLLSFHKADPEKYKCNRCSRYGGTVSCYLCGKYYHGNDCAQYRLIDCSDLSNRKQYKCYFCLNSERFQNQDLKEEPDKLNISYPLTNSQTNPIEQYVPQVGDIVMYFYKGHEEYIKQNDHLFFNGSKIDVEAPKIYPFITYQELKGTEVACLIEDIKVQEPSEYLRRFKQMNLMAIGKAQIANLWMTMIYTLLTSGKFNSNTQQKK